MLGNKRKYPKYRVSHSGGGMGGVLPPSYDFFRNPRPPAKPILPPWSTPPHLKRKPHLKNKASPLKRETLFHEMIPRKSTITNHFKSS